MLKLEKKRIPIGYEDFKDIIDNDFYYVDKTMLIYEAMLRSHRMRHGLPRCVFTLRQPRVFYLCSLYMIWHRRRSLSSRPSPSPVPIIMPFSTHQLTASCAHRGMLSSI